MRFLQCRFCRVSERDGDINGMITYSWPRHHAHAICLFKAKGEAAILALPLCELRRLPVLEMRDVGIDVIKITTQRERAENRSPNVTILEDIARLNSTVRARDIVKRAAEMTTIVYARQWLLHDERGIWEHSVLNYLKVTATQAEILALTVAQVDEQISMKLLCDVLNVLLNDAAANRKVGPG